MELGAGTTGNYAYEGAFTIASVPAGNQFTYTQYGVADDATGISMGTARVNGQVRVKWSAPANYTTLRNYIYRCTGGSCTLPANAANYSLVGVSVGMDGSFLDYGFSVTPAYIGNGDVPSTAPTTAVNDWLPTTISAGGGGTTLTLAASATNTVSNAKVLHDNAPILKVACNAFPLSGSSTGGIITIPAPTNATWQFPIASTFNESSCPSQTEFDFAAQLYMDGTIIPRTISKHKGLAPGNVNQSAPFYSMQPTAVINGDAYPFFYMSNSGSFNLSLESMILVCPQVYQTCVYQDANNIGSGPVSIRYTDVFLNGGNGSLPYVAKGGFGFFWDRGGWGANAQNFASPPAALFTVNCGPGQSNQALPGIVYTDKTYIFGGLLLDSCGSGLYQNTGHWEFHEVLAESGFGPVVRANLGGGGLYGVDFLNFTNADAGGGQATPMFDMSNATTYGMRFPARELQLLLRAFAGNLLGNELLRN